MLRSRRRVVALAPGGVALLDLPARKRHAVELPADAGEDWRPAVQSLRTFCEQNALRGASFEVLLSHAFARFLVAPWSDALLSAATAAAYLGGLFEATHGSRGSLWHCAAEDRLDAGPRIAAGIERALLDELAACAAACGARLATVAPWIVAAFARERRRIRRADGWFAALEPGWVTLATVRGGRIDDLARLTFEGDADAALARALRRQSLREGLDAAAPLVAAGRADAIDWMALAT